MNQNISIAATLAVRNRAETTLNCIRELADQLSRYPGSRIIVVDDASTDGTPGRIEAEYPDVQVIRADGDQYWGGAMKIAEAAALQTNFTHLLWVNDDASLASDAVSRLVETSVRHGVNRTIATGAMSWPHQHRLTSYSGARRKTRLGLMRLVTVDPSDEDTSVDATNGNLVLIPRQAIIELSGLDRRFTHRFGDYDFSMRAAHAGYLVMLAPGFLGETPRNGNNGTHLDRHASRRERLRRLRSKKGLPFGQKAAYLRRHGGLSWPVQLIVMHSYHVARALAIPVRDSQ
ncbi:glycosyltransferase family 2 protein [Aeromicrobium wangtongii]|uniref:Glycosyltransferase family 2 protein n=1 Tax=Aeromicrobium wangtongii TaxID=2969247 RepID=A0ABY5M6Q3_9ACTN|nr:glycosyltransferase family 2 protein [Aeromicrobium wangtongii]MCD9199485.1 glycosyltransferase family 2 protein [Aeromicrobium wangtongii]UUP13838.1 glycosyltransferase family 2 protein [Aeromicrobium wangtongii]